MQGNLCNLWSLKACPPLLPLYGFYFLFSLIFVYLFICLFIFYCFHCCVSCHTHYTLLVHVHCPRTNRQHQSIFKATTVPQTITPYCVLILGLVSFRVVIEYLTAGYKYFQTWSKSHDLTLHRINKYESMDNLLVFPVMNYTSETGAR